MKSWILAKKFLLDPTQNSEDKIKKFFNLKERGVTLYALDYHEGFKNPRFHFRFHIKPGTFINFISSYSTGMSEYAIAICHSNDQEFDFKPYNLKLNINNVIFSFDLSMNVPEVCDIFGKLNDVSDSDCEITYAHFNKTFIEKIKKDFFQSEMNDLNFYRELTKSRSRVIKKLTILDYPKESKEKLGYLPSLDQKRYDYFQNFFENDGYNFTLESMMILLNILENSYSQYKYKSNNFKGDLQVYNARGEITLDDCYSMSQNYLRANFYFKFKDKSYYAKILLEQALNFGSHEYKGRAYFHVYKNKPNISEKTVKEDVSFGVTWFGKKIKKAKWEGGSQNLKKLEIDYKWLDFKKEILNQLMISLPNYGLQNYQMIINQEMKVFIG